MEREPGDRKAAETPVAGYSWTPPRADENNRRTFRGVPMAFDAQAFDLAAETDEVVRSFEMRPTRSSLWTMAEEMQRRLRVYPGGAVQAARIVAEIKRRALAQRP